MNIKYLSSSCDMSELEGMTRGEVDDITVEVWERDDALAELINGMYSAVEVAGATFDPADVIKSCDPIMWNVMVADEFIEVYLDDYPDEACSECGVSLDGGEGFNGLCGNCAEDGEAACCEAPVDAGY